MTKTYNLQLSSGVQQSCHLCSDGLVRALATGDVGEWASATHEGCHGRDGTRREEPRLSTRGQLDSSGFGYEERRRRLPVPLGSEADGIGLCGGNLSLADGETLPLDSLANNASIARTKTALNARISTTTHRSIGPTTRAEHRVWAKLRVACFGTASSFLTAFFHHTNVGLQVRNFSLR